jgi:hypothetical protein
MGERRTHTRRAYEDAVEYLCRNAEALRELIGAEHWREPFAAVRDGAHDTPEWQDAVRELHEAAETAGIPGGLGLRSTMGAGGWPSGPPPRSTGWVCPTGRCGRVDLREGEPLPETPLCALAGGPMRLVGG